MHPSCPQPIPAFHTCHTAPMAPSPSLSSPPDPQPTLQLGMCQKHLWSLLKYRLFLEELGFEGFAFFCLWNTVYLEQKDEEGQQAACMPCVTLKCHSKGCACARCPCGCLGQWHQSARQKEGGCQEACMELWPSCPTNSWMGKSGALFTSPLGDFCHVGNASQTCPSVQSQPVCVPYSSVSVHWCSQVPCQPLRCPQASASKQGPSGPRVL